MEAAEKTSLAAEYERRSGEPSYYREYDEGSLDFYSVPTRAYVAFLEVEVDIARGKLAKDAKYIAFLERKVKKAAHKE